MSAPGNVPVDVMAILTDLQQQVSDLTGIVEAQQRTLDALTGREQPAHQPSPHAAPSGPGGA
jgi:hypothetical protein